MTVRGVFVVGSPRSGTTMLGNYLGSAQSVLNTGEYRALYLAFGALPVQLYGALPGLVPDEWEARRVQYLREAQDHAVQFVTEAAAAGGCTAFCDSTPRNLFVAAQLAERFPDALFVVSLRHYTGVIQSLLRLGMMSLLPGRERSIDFVEPTAVAAGAYWAQHYQLVPTLPVEQTVIFGYDAFCIDPAATLDRLKQALGAHGFPVDQLDDGVFAKSHAVLEEQLRPRIATSGGRGVELSPIPSYDARTWTDQLDRDVRPYVHETDEMLSLLFPDDYRRPAGYEPPQDRQPGDRPGAGPS